MIRIECKCELCGKEAKTEETTSLPEGFFPFAIHKIAAQNECKRISILCADCGAKDLVIKVKSDA